MYRARVFGGMLMIAVAIMVFGEESKATVPPLVNYQGILYDSSGQPAVGSFSVEFNVWDSFSGGASVWSETQSIVTDSSGLFNVQLGSVNPIDDAVFEDVQAWLGVAIDGGTELTRTRIVTVGYSFRVSTVDSASGGTVVGDVAITGRVTIGPSNTNTGTASFVAGDDNSSLADWSTIGGGRHHVMEDAVYNTIAGGVGNSLLQTEYSMIGGGAGNEIEDGAHGSIIGGGVGNVIGSNEWTASILGGAGNIVGTINQPTAKGAVASDSAVGSVIAGGHNNQATGSFSAIAGGYENLVAGDYASIAGGRDNLASGYASFAGGSGARVRHAGSFVWSDSSDTVGSTGANQFRVGARGGVEFITDTGLTMTTTDGDTTAHFSETIYFNRRVGIGTRSPTRDFEVNGMFLATGGIVFPDSSVLTTATGTVDVGGWSDDGVFVRLDDPGDMVGIGTPTPMAKLDVEGDLRVSMSATFGAGNVNSGAFGLVAGDGNMLTGTHSTITGGFGNSATGDYSTVTGGFHNHAMGHHSLAAGTNANAMHDGSVVIAAHHDIGDGDSIFSGDLEQMVLRADNGFYLSDTGGVALVPAGVFLQTSTGATLSKSGDWTNLSDANSKENFTTIDRAELLIRLAKLPITRWNYKSDDPSVQHIGPTAQDFAALFAVGRDNRAISTVDPSGIALAAIQELNARMETIKAQRDQIEALERRLSNVEQLIRSLSAENR